MTPEERTNLRNALEEMNDLDWTWDEVIGVVDRVVVAPSRENTNSQQFIQEVASQVLSGEKELMDALWNVHDAAAREAREEEREECAKEGDAYAAYYKTMMDKEHPHSSAWRSYRDEVEAGEEIAAAIRARKDEE